MANSEDTGADRRRKLERVRTEIEKYIAAGRTPTAGEWVQRYPDLNPELGELLARLTEGQEAATPQKSATAPVEDAGATVTAFGVSPGSGQSGAAAGDAAIHSPTQTDFRKPEERSSAASASRSRPAEALRPGFRLRYVGDYELLSVLGQGGMGVVYKARQVSLNRDVAVKMIRNAEFASEEQIRRFQNEAESVALVDHPGIVPIYEVGNHEDQRYFSMKLIEGEGLDKRLKASPLKPGIAAELVAEVAEAIHHAHQRGLLHRDLKPANILIDAEGHPHVTDFGLSKRIEDAPGLTVSGAIMGTPAYMAPEQALGRNSQVTTTSDVYGLGGVLYAALTGRDPFGGDSVLETLERVRHTPPEAPSSINKQLPQDLEVICLKCLEKDPQRRYASAQQLADDLHRWLNGEPIVARPVGAAARAWMWCKRKPALAGLSGALTVALACGVIGIAWQWREAIFQRNAAVAARDAAVHQEAAARKAEADARTARGLAEENALLASRQATLALNTVQDIIGQVQTNLSGPGLFEVKTAVLNTALNRIEGVAAVYDKSTSKEATVMAIYMELAKVYQALGKSEKALAILDRALDIGKARVIIKENSDPSRMNLANLYLQRAFLYEEVGRDMKAALTANQEGLRIWQDIYNHPKRDQFALDPKVVRMALGEAYTRVAVSKYRLGDIAAAQDGFRKAYDLRQELVQATSGDPQLKQDLSYSAMALAEGSFRLGDAARADEYYRQTLQWREKRFADKAKDPQVRAELSDVNYMIGEFKLKTGDLAEARKRLERSRELRAALVEADGRNATWKRNLAISLYRLGSLADREKNEKAALESFEASRKLSQQLVDEDPHNDKRSMELMTSLAHVGQIDKAAGIADRFSAGPKLDNELRLEIARCYAQCARGALDGEAALKAGLQLKAIEVLRAAVANGFRDRVYLDTEPDLDPLRNREDFQALVAKLPLGAR
jgi:tetratricopeptide (TPR) repeat protein/tRNA A-37 threonylcarbamoyl transferase component Bud32